MNARVTAGLQLMVSALGGCVVGFAVVVSFKQPPEARIAASAALLDPQRGSPKRVFASDAGIVVKFVKADRTADFEATVAKLREALTRSDDPRRRQQAAGWKVYRAIESATNGDAVYVFELDPAIQGVDYTVSAILAEAFPAEAESLYRRYANSSSAAHNVLNLMLIADLGE